ncbi:MAG: MCE family protein [Spirochaetia bacterium]|nr:MCE family protein [Spirochaetia bacterium]
MEDNSKHNIFSFWIGILLLITTAIGIGYIGSKKISYAEQFYNIIFEMDFLEDIRPGTKIRYQGGVIVGEVQYIESRYQNHLVYARIKKNFLIPKYGSVVSLKTWGYFGGKFVNIDILNANKEADSYSENSIILVQNVKNISIIMNDINKFITSKDKYEFSPLELKLKEVQSMANLLDKNSFFNPDVIRSLVTTSSHKYKRYFEIFAELNLSFYNHTIRINELVDNSYGKLQENLPKIKRDVEELKKIFLYEDSFENKYTPNYWHEETSYYYTKALIEYIKYKSEYFKNYPYKILYSN